MISNRLLLIIFSCLILSCASIPAYTDVTSTTFTAKVIDGETGEQIIGLVIIEAEDPTNLSTTDLEGNFNLQFNHEYPIIMISWSYSPIYLNVSEINNGIIFYDKTLDKKSRKAKKQLTKWKKREAKNKMQ
ncbi:MAG: hypothetical protein P1U56_10500 [Saprospiraceae bacterium]|nr:hypothetical protein [Saprospiraceae bacterium]